MDYKQINSYESTQKIGESTTSVIYKAYDLEHNRVVSIKQLKPTDSIKRDVHKIKCYIGIEHPNLSTVYSVEEYNDSIIIISDYIEGVTLKQLFSKSAFEKENLLDLLKQISCGLSALHTQNLLHGNLKPSNIIVTDSGEIVLLDAGLSPFDDFQNSPEFMAPYDACHYLAPEQVKNEPMSQQSDFFALGVIAYRLSFGRLPFVGDNEEQLTHAILNDKPDFSSSEQGYEQRINRLLLGKLLAKKRQDRFTDTSELMATLLEINQFDENSSKYSNLDTIQENPRKYLKVSLLAILVILLWSILSFVSI